MSHRRTAKVITSQRIQKRDQPLNLAIITVSRRVQAAVIALNRAKPSLTQGMSQVKISMVTGDQEQRRLSARSRCQI